MRKIALLTSVLALTACTINIDGKSDDNKVENPGYNEYPSWGWDDDNNNQGDDQGNNGDNNQGDNNWGDNNNQGNDQGNNGDNNWGDNNQGNDQGNNGNDNNNPGNTGDNDPNYPGYVEPDSGGINISDLDKIDFKGTFDGPYKIVVSDGQIVSVTEPDFGWTAHLENGDVTKLTVDTVDGVLEIDYLDSGYLAMQGKDVGLRFSDFGYLLLNLTEENEEDGLVYPFTAVDVFAGGYADKAIEKPADSARFDGTATAAITYDTSYNYEEQTVRTTTNDASLYFDANSGTETLTMNFSKADNPWYDVQISDGTVTLSNPGAVTSEELRVKDDWLYSNADAYVDTRVHYFGENNNATEAVATSTFFGTGALQDDNTEHLIYVDSVFGGKRQ